MRFPTLKILDFYELVTNELSRNSYLEKTLFPQITIFFQTLISPNKCSIVILRIHIQVLGRFSTQTLHII